MTSMQAAVLYAGLFCLFMLVLKANVGRVRTKHKVGFGDGGHEEMQRSLRVQGNAVEDVPVVLLGLIGLGAMEVPALLIHSLGASFLLGRVLHAYGLGGSSGSSFGRSIGTLITALVMVTTAGACIWFAVT